MAQAEMTGGSFSSVGRSATSTQAEVSTLGWGRGRGRPSRGRRGRTCASQLDSVDQGIGFTRKSHNMREALCRDRYCEEEVDITQLVNERRKVALWNSKDVMAEEQQLIFFLM